MTQTEMHTPGPWRVSVKGKGIGIIGPVSKDFPLGEHIAHMTSGRPNIRANARLIAASPTMHDYISRRAASGDEEAVAILESINAAR